MIVFISSYVFTSVLYVVIKLLATIVTILCPNASSIMYRFLRFNSMVLGKQRLEWARKGKVQGPKKWARNRPFWWAYSEAVIGLRDAIYSCK
jgi:hypothetical protein